MIDLDWKRCRDVWVPDESEAGGFWSPPPEHVRIGVREIVGHPYFYLGDDMGGMKTAQALIAAQFLHDGGIIDRLIVVAPASIRPKVWFDEDLGQVAEQVFNDKRVLVSEYHQRVRQWRRGPEGASEFRIIITNYEYIRTERHLQALLPYCGLRTMLVLDESSAVRGYKSDQTDAVMRMRWLTNRRGRPILGAPRCGRVLEMNGTPVAESPLDMFSQANILHPDILECRYVTHFKARYAVQTPVRGSGGRVLLNPKTGKPLTTVDSWVNLEDLQRRIAPYMLRREAKQFGVDFALPPVGLEVTLSAEEWRVYRAMRDEMVAWLKSGVASARQAGVKAIRLAQITSGFVGGVEDEFYDDAMIASLTQEVDGQPWPRSRTPEVVEVGRSKLDFALEWHADLLRKHPDLKLLTWCRFVPELRRYLRAEISARPEIQVGAACGERIFNGEHSKKDERDHALKLLHPRTSPPGAVTVGATQGTGAVGLNFTACRTVLDMSYDSSPWKKKQADARTNRTGQTGPVSFFYLIAVGPKGQKTIDHHTMMARLGKMNLNDWTVAAWVRHLAEE